MKFLITALPIAATLAAANPILPSCNTAKDAPCGNEQGTTCCSYGQYCQPWNPGFYQCRDTPAQCGQQFVDMDFYGNDLTTVNGIQPDECCARCVATSGCTGYTFVSLTCYLKTGQLQQRPKKGAVSGMRGPIKPWANPLPPVQYPSMPSTWPSNKWTPPNSNPNPNPWNPNANLNPNPKPNPNPNPWTPNQNIQCSTPPNDKCGNDGGITCCPNGQYCQPWNPGFYQCMPLPYKCARQLTNVDFYGNDIRVIHGLQPAVCCEECSRTPGCRAYTFINSNPGSPACYLKSGERERRNKVGAVSGVLN